MCQDLGLALVIEQLNKIGKVSAPCNNNLPYLSPALPLSRNPPTGRGESDLLGSVFNLSVPGFNLESIISESSSTSLSTFYAFYSARMDEALPLGATPNTGGKQDLSCCLPISLFLSCREMLHALCWSPHPSSIVSFTVEMVIRSSLGMTFC